MLTDNSLTNILALSGVSNIRYKVFSEISAKSDLVFSLTNDEQHEILPIIQSYNELVSLNIPCIWQAALGQKSKSNVSIELWVFWFDEKTAEVVDQQLHLKEFREIRSSSFNWNQWCSNTVSPTSSPQLSKINNVSSLTPGEEYKLFIKSIRALIKNTMLTKRNGLTLGEFFIFPDATDEEQTFLTESLSNDARKTMLAYTYNVYLTNSNLVFQPSIRRIRLRPLLQVDIFTKDLKVLMSPTGEYAKIISFQSHLTQELQNQILTQWSKFYNLSIQSITQTYNSISSLITIRTASQHTVTYPSKLLFVPTDTKDTPSSIAGMNGIMGFNHGMAQSLGEKLSRFSYYDGLKMSKQTQTVDYWSYREPIFYVENAVIQSLSSTDAKYQHDQVVLHRALTETVVSSPIMNNKSVIPSDHEPLSLNTRRTSTPPLPARRYRQYLAEYALSEFGIQPVENISTTALSADVNGGNGSYLSDILSKNLTITLNVEAQLMEIETDTIQPQATPLPDTQQALQPKPGQTSGMDLALDNENQPLNDFNMLYSELGGQADLWDTHEDFDLNMDVTEADFDFFERTTAATAPITVTGPVVALQETVSTLSASKESTTENTELMMTTMPTHAPVESTLNVDSLFTPLIQPEDMLIEKSTQGAQPGTQIEIVQPDPIIKKRIPHQKATPELLTFVPQDFLPVLVDTTVNDAKYSSGGKFMYPQSDEEKTREKTRFIYNPDYVPRFSLKKSTKKTNRIAKEANKNSVMKDLEYPSGMNDSASVNSSDSSSRNSSSSSSSKFSDDSDSSTDTEDDMMDRNVIDKRLKSLKKFQKTIVNSILKPVPAPLPSDRLKQIDFDTPFVPILSGEYIKPISWRESKSMQQCVSYLCQQAVLGGYPFAGGLAEVCGSGGEIESEPSKIMVARRTNLMQITRGMITHVPSVRGSSAKILMDFKQLLNDIFIRTSNEDDMHNVEAATFLKDVPLGKISIKGPLNIQQYYRLNDTQNQANAKYGRYQVKKKRPSEPNLHRLEKPNIVVSRHDDLLEGSSKMLPYWEKIGLQPYSVKKSIKYFVVFPSNPDIRFIMQNFFKELSVVYGSCHLGKHEPENTRLSQCGLVPVPLLPTEENETDIKQQLRSYENVCQTLGTMLAHQSENTNHTVVYIVNPGPQMSSYLDMCRCFYKLQEGYKSANPQKFAKNHARLVLQLIPIDHILRSSAFGGYQLQGMKDIAFSVYSKCFTTVNRKAKNEVKGSSTDIYSPAFVLSKPIPTSIQYKLDDVRLFPIILDKNARLHVAYCFSYDRAWMIVVWTDDYGELLEYGLFNRKTAYKDAWERTKQITKRTESLWTVVLTKIGLMFNDELMLWLRVMTNIDKYYVTITSIDLESSLSLHFEGYPGANSLSEQHPSDHNKAMPIFSSTSSNSYSGMNSNSSSEDLYATQAEMTESQVLLLNHRISYTQKREKAFKGILRTEAMSEKENWMIPLATGYLIHHSLPNKNVNPCMEQFNYEPFIAEIHLLYNKTPHSAYSVLQEILKKFHDLSFVDPILSSRNCIPYHIVLAERLSRLLLVVDSSMK